MAVPHQFIVNFKDGMGIQQYFIVRQVEERVTQNGKPYLNLVLGDKTGTIRGKIWSNVLRDYPGPFCVGDYVGTVGLVTSYQGELELTLQKIWTLEQIKQKKELGSQDPKDFDATLLHAATEYDQEQMWRDLLTLAREVLEPPLLDLVVNLLEENAEAWKEKPAARRIHHAYLGGLLEHTWFVARLANQMAQLYPHLNRQLVVAGAILHDLGKIVELDQPYAPEYTIVGQLVGHIVLGWEMIRQEAARIDFADHNLLRHLEHIILTHHGQREFGSPILPKTQEALMVSMADDLDAKLKIMAQHLQADTSAREFTSYNRLLQRELYKISPENTEELPDQD